MKRFSHVKYINSNNQDTTPKELDSLPEPLVYANSIILRHKRLKNTYGTSLVWSRS